MLKNEGLPAKGTAIRLYSLRSTTQNPRDCHPEAPQAAKDPCICLVQQMPGFFAAL